ncbi:vWA domain-containing protein [Estrella lausannensis]|uniref:VWFA domain-containing protein n=1 Tax=Estrella lausannensis TaxID=483423 RepID=A0A0H5DQS3_9BACT|nr:VWA domain-containing protein [Estrella lausannensis]CRX37949.1 hypothetical protein ELAC_0594 [Estrella lausannensis]
MDLSQLHFSHPLWLALLLAIPLVGGLYFLYYRRQQPLHQLEKLIDKHLIPYLLLQKGLKREKSRRQVLIWSIAWCLLVLALAGPRWSFREIDTFSRDQSLAILLDLSESMNVQDVLPSRLGRAKQKIEDLLSMSKGVKVGLIAFAADPHMIAPMTDDKETIRHLLPSLDTDLVFVQGSKLTPALEMAGTMLENEPGTNKAIVVISDGGFGDASAIHTAKTLADKGIVLHTMGVGSPEGAPLKNRQGAVLKKDGAAILSKLEKEKFREISKMGNGRYFDADHSQEAALIFEDLKKRANLQKEVQKTRTLWDERFYLFLLPVLPLFLFWFRRGCLFSLLLFTAAPSSAQASLPSFFYNEEQKASQAYEKGDYQTAADTFEDPYRRGVAYYRMGDYQSAEEMFGQSTRPEVASMAAYNLGNALAKQNKLQEAIKAYEDVLEKWPDHKLAKENLDLIKKMLEEQQQQNQNEDKSNPEDQQQKEDEQDSSPQENENEPSQKPSSEKESSKNPNEQKEADRPEKQEQPSKADHQLQTAAKPQPRSQEDLDADLWLNQIKSDPKSFLKTKFYLESKRNGTKEEVDPW